MRPRAPKSAQDGLALTGWPPVPADQAVALERAQPATSGGFARNKEACGEVESECPGCCGAQGAFHVGTLKGVGRICSKAGFAKPYGRKTPITAAGLLNNRVVPFAEPRGSPDFDGHGIKLCPSLAFGDCRSGGSFAGADRPGDRAVRHLAGARMPALPRRAAETRSVCG